MATSPRPGDPDFGSTIPADGKPILVGRYRVLRKLGEGGMGEVYLAEDQKLDNKRFAIKMPPAVLARNARAVETLKKEALRAMELSHPHIVTVRSFEQSDDGVFIIMDYIEGETLEELLRRQGTLNEKELLRLFTPIAEALDYAHKKNVIHRDVKPSNIIVATDGTPYIMDFGIAREAKETFTRVTGKETTSGTLPYMSPEQVRGKPPAPAQDVYSLAATMYECLAGYPPFHRGDVHYQIINEPPEPPESPSSESESASSSPLVRLIMRGLAKEASERPASCAAMVKPEQPKKTAAPKPTAPPEPEPKKPPALTTQHPTPRKAAPTPQPRRQADRKRPSVVGRGIGVLTLLVIAAVVITVIVSQMDSSRPSLPPRAPGTSPKRGEPWTVNLGGGVEMTFVYIEAGTFMMGSPLSEEGRDSDEGPRHEVHISKGFWLGETEVTQAQWKAVMGSGNNPSCFKGDSLPVEEVSWDDAKAFCEQLSQETGQRYRLPSEAEWEYACRAGTTTPFNTGSTISRDQANYDGDSTYGNGRKGVDREKTTPVKTFSPNAWSLYDMHGNVWEWCEDVWYESYNGNPPMDGSAWMSGVNLSLSRVLRGGSWLDNPLSCRSATRDLGLLINRFNIHGFRVSLDSN